MEVAICVIVGLICIMDKKFQVKNWMGEILNVIMYLFIIMTIVSTIDFLLFGEKINVLEYKGNFLRVVTDVVLLILSILGIKIFRCRNELTKKDKSIYFVITTMSFSCFFYGVIYDVYAKDSVVINEISSNNFLYYSEEEKYSGDYIELYNPSYITVSLDGYILSDEDYYYDLSGYIISPFGYLVLSTNDKDKQLDFSISANGETIVLSREGKEIDSVEVPSLEKDVFFAREEKNDNRDWIKVTEATPNQANIVDVSKKFPTLNTPVFSLECGFYDEPIEVEISTEYKNCKIYYTLDGTEPTTESLVYNGPIKLDDYSVNSNKYSAIEGTSIDEYLPNYYVDKANILKAIVVSENGDKSAVVSNTYFIGFNNKSGYDNVKIMSLVVNEDDLFSYEKGIYVLGEKYENWLEGYILENNSLNAMYEIKANYEIKGKISERDVHIEFFDENKNLLEEGSNVIKIHGGISRAVLNKSLAINSYSEKSIFYNNKYVLRSKHVIFTEAFTQTLVADRNIGIQNNMGACALFINGEYWGTYMIQERSKEQYFEENFGILEANLLDVKNREVYIGDESDIYLYNELLALCNEDCTIDENYDKVCEIIDKQSLIDYFCFNLYIGNNDWPYNNYSCWRSKNILKDSEYQDGKWRWNVFDVDSGSTDLYRNSFYEGINTSRKKPLDHPVIFQLIKNDEFKKDFVNTFLDLGNYNFSPEVVCPKIDTMKELYMSSVINNSKRFSNENYSEIDAEIDIGKLYDFYNNRFDYIVPIMADELGLSGTLEEITLEVNDVNGGNITINTITPEMNSDCTWMGRYYTDYTVSVTANPKEGYRFVGWEGTYEGSDSTMEVVIVPDGVTVKAIFEKID